MNHLEIKTYRTWSQTVLCVVFLCVSFTVRGQAGLDIDENFAYPSGASLSGNGNWTTVTSTGTNPIMVGAGSLAYNTYGSSGVANMMQISSTPGAGVSKNIGAFIGMNSYYAGFLISVSAAPGNPSGATVTFDGNGNNQFRNSGLTFRNSGGNLQIGLYNHSSGSSAFIANNYVFGQVYFVVVEFDNSMTGGRFRLYVNPPINQSKPGNNINIWLSSGASNSDNIAALVFHQEGGTAASIDGIRAGETWAADIVALETPVYNAEGLSLTSAAPNSMNVSFTGAVDIPTGYIVVRKSGSLPSGSPVDNTTYNAGDVLGDGVVVYSGTATSFTDNNSMSAQTRYYYSVFSMNSANGQTKYLTSSVLSGNAFTLSTEPANGPVSFTASSPSDSQINLTFSSASSITNADGYLLFRSTDAVSSLSFISDGVAPGSFSMPAGLTPVADITNSAQSSYNDPGRASNTTYTYVLVPYNYDGANSQTYNYFTSSISSVPGLTRPAAPVANQASSPTKSGFSASWSATVLVADYRLDVATTNAFGSDIISGYNNLTVSGTSHNVTGLSPDTEYFYRVRAVNSSGASSNSNAISQRTVTNAPVASEETGVGSTGFTANWSAVPGATGYKIDVASNADFSSILSAYSNVTINGTNAAVSALSTGTTYYYRVRALNSAGASENSNTITALTKPGAPVVGEATLITNSSFVANWSAATGATEYRLDVFIETAGNFLDPYNNFLVSGTMQAISGLDEGVTYLYKVRATNDSGPSVDSDVMSVATIPPVPGALPPTLISTTGFTANWSLVSGATSYLLYVTDNALNVLDGYDGKSLSAAFETVSGLQSSTDYQYYVKAKNTSGISNASESIPVLTLPSPPGNPAATSVTQTGFIATWDAVPGVVEYLLDVSDDNFTSNLTGFDNLSVSTTSGEVTGLIPGNSYSFRVRAKNATGPSADSDIITVILVPPAPTTTPPDPLSVGQNGFTAQWNSVNGAENYVLDVSDNAGFASFLTGYNGKVLPSDQTTEQIASLSPGMIYYYRVLAKNSSGESSYSNTVSQITVPGQPILNQPAQITSSSFFASWETVPGATAYELDAYSSSDNFVTLDYVTGYESRQENATEDFVTGLTPTTIYRFRVRAKNAAGVSENSSHKSVLTLKPDGTVENPPSISTATPTQPNTVKAQISGGLAPWTVTLHHKKITESTFGAEPGVEIATNTVDFPVTNYLDELGMEYYFKVTDVAARESLSTPAKYTVSFEANTRTFLEGSFAGNRSSITMISIPYVLNNNAVETLFGSLGVYDKKTWRLAHYSNQRNIEYQTPGFPAIDRGVGFWFNARVLDIDLKTSSGNAGPNDQNNPFVLELDEGWNHIGNPYPFAIDWADVIADNPTKTGVSDELKIYDGRIQNFKAADDLNVYEGAFVFAESPTNLDLKVTLRNSFTAGRKKNTESHYDLGLPDWEVPLLITQGQSTHTLAAFGMHPEGNESKDKFDGIRLPRFEEYLDVTFEHPEYKFPHFTKDIVPTSSEYTWSFTVETTDIYENTLINWDNTKFGINDAQLFLLDMRSGTLINMREESSFTYPATENRLFKIYYTRGDQAFSPGIFLLGGPYPNPSRDQVYVNLVLPDAQNDYEVELVLYDYMGKPVSHVVNSRLPGGVHQVLWDGKNYSGDAVASGFYLMRAKANGQMIGAPQRLLILK